MEEPTQIDIAKRVDQYVKLRDKIKDIKKRHEEELKPYAEALETLNTMLLGYLNNIHTDSASIKGVGTVYKTAKDSASIADGDAFRRFVIGSEAWDLLDFRANKTAVRDFMENHNEPPPGVNFTTTYVVGVRRG